MASGLFRDSEGWVFFHDEYLDDEYNCTDGWKHYRKCLEVGMVDTNYTLGSYKRPRLLVPTQLITFNNETDV